MGRFPRHSPAPRRLFMAGFTGAILFGLVACGGDGSEGGGRGGLTLNGAGATFAMPLISTWSSEYQAETGSRVNYNSIGSGGGIRAHTDRTVDFAASEAPLSPEQFANAPGTLTLPFTIGTVAIAYNVPGVEELRLSGEVLGAIYRGEIRRWSNPAIQELNPGSELPDTEIVVVHRSDGSGTTYVFTEYLSKLDPVWAEDVGFSTSVSWPRGIGGNGNEGVAGAIRNSRGSIGYVELSYLDALSLPAALIRNQEGEFLAPTLDGGTLAAETVVGQLPAGHEPWHEVSFTDPPGAGAYPISSFSYFFVYEELSTLGSRMTRERAESIVRWLEWAVTEGQRFNNEVQNAALPEALQERNLATLDRIRFNGDPIRTW
ncbi:MAG: phosphate ABC transporter substrate-binding protein PstS [Gemmatimonadales bacterium]|nr:MAG: phosphate ABC transporter substrate-binding protein PstS [Gemmatimonadales bacterium]